MGSEMFIPAKDHIREHEGRDVGNSALSYGTNESDVLNKDREKFAAVKIRIRKPDPHPPTPRASPSRQSRPTKAHAVLHDVDHPVLDHPLLLGDKDYEWVRARSRRIGSMGR